MVFVRISVPALISDRGATNATDFNTKSAPAETHSYYQPAKKWAQYSMVNIVFIHFVLV